MENKETFVAFLRGINVGGKHKVPMVDLKKYCLEIGLENPKTILNSGNLILSSSITSEDEVENVLRQK